ncbi:hypothetical protein LTR74_007941 [Friedmanniomyces endolithicus]|nr:hypothetical protein LTR74_007941 [Friedmanniomyces endolithicus]
MENARRKERKAIKYMLNKFLDSAESRTIATEDLEAKLEQMLLQKLQGREDRGTPTVRKDFPEHYDPEGDKSWLRRAFRTVLRNESLVATGRDADEEMDDEELPPPLATTKAERKEQDAEQGGRRRTPAVSKKGTSEIMKHLNETAPRDNHITVQQRRPNPAKDHQHLRPKARVHYDEGTDDEEEFDNEGDKPNIPTTEQAENFVVCDRSLAIRNGCAEASSSDTKPQGAEPDYRVSALSRSVGGSFPSVMRSWQILEGKMVVCPPFANAESKGVVTASAGSMLMSSVPNGAAEVRSMDSLASGTKRSWQRVDGKMMVWPPFDGEKNCEDAVRGIKRKVGVEEEGAGTGKKVRTR